jgi:hypothetical protein
MSSSGVQITGTLYPSLVKERGLDVDGIHAPSRSLSGSEKKTTFLCGMPRLSARRPLAVG